MEKYPKVCIIILNWNGKELLKDCLSSLFKNTDYPNYKVIVVDNGSTDGSIDFVKKSFKKADILPLDKNYGFSKGNNEGIKYALKKYNPKYLVILNNDTEIVEKNWLKEMVTFSESDEKIGIVACKAITLDGRIESTGYIDGKSISRITMQVPSNKINKICENFIISICILVKKNVFEAIGGFDEIYSPYLYEDIDFFVRAKRAGFRLFYFGKTKIIHKVSQSLKKESNLKRIFIGNRNDIIFHLKYAKGLVPFRILRMIVRSFVVRDITTSYKTWVFQKNSLSLLLITFKSIFSAFKIYRNRFKKSFLI
jgi:GT2 family glycosyltransferase